MTVNDQESTTNEALFSNTPDHILKLVATRPQAYAVWDDGFRSGWSIGFNAAVLKQREHERQVDEQIKRDMKFTQDWPPVQRHRAERPPASKVPSVQECLDSWNDVLQQDRRVA